MHGAGFFFGVLERAAARSLCNGAFLSGVVMVFFRIFAIASLALSTVVSTLMSLAGLSGFADRGSSVPFFLPWLIAISSIVGLVLCGSQARSEKINEGLEKNTSEIVKLQEILSSKVRRKPPEK